MDSQTQTQNNVIVTITPVTCKNCGSGHVVKFGTYKGNQRYYCKDCQRKFKADGTQFHEKVSSEYITRAVGEYFKGMSINDIRESLKEQSGYYPSKSVVYKWINKYTVTPKTKMDLSKALKRKRGPQPRGHYEGESISSIQARKRLTNRASLITQPLPPITPKMGKLA